jgi:hypothetical protein
MSASQKKVYDYEPAKVREALVDVFKKRRGEATTADLVALTGLPKAQVEAEVVAVSDEFGARLRVTDSGEILYSFPAGLRSRYRGLGPSASRAWKAFKKAAAKVAALAFKVWIVVMLVGYFALFVVLAILALLASVAGSASGSSSDSRSSRSDRGGGGLGGLFVAGRLLDTLFKIWFYSELFLTPEQRAARAGRKRERRPLYKAIYSFVFGDGDPDAGWEGTEKKAFVAFVQANKGIITMPEFMALTGLRPLEAEERINRFLYEFEGSPEVSEGGTIYYSFPALLRRKDRGDRNFGTVPMRRIAPFSSNAKKANATFCAFNAVNLVFGSYFLYGALSIPAMDILLSHARIAGFDYLYVFTTFLAAKYGGIADPTALLGIVLGAVPLAFSLLFYAIPALRARRLEARNEAARRENLRRVAYRAVLDSPVPVRPESVPVYDDAARPKDSQAAAKALSELAAWSGAEPQADGSYDFAELRRGRAEAAKARAAVDEGSFALGDVAFDSEE